MKILLDKLRPYGFNDRRLTEKDFYRICEKEQITVMENNDVASSFYLSVMGKHFIVIGKRLRGVHRLHAMFHELVHHWHSGHDEANAFFYGLNDSKPEAEADALACIALIPERDLGKFGILNEYPRVFAKKIYNDRMRIYFLYNI